MSQPREPKGRRRKCALVPLGSAKLQKEYFKTAKDSRFHLTPDKEIGPVRSALLSFGPVAGKHEGAVLRGEERGQAPSDGSPMAATRQLGESPPPCFERELQYRRN